MTSPDDPFKHLTTEQPNPASGDLDLLSPSEFLSLMQAEDEKALAALVSVQGDLVRMIEELAERFRGGGRLFYVGAGTSGRLGMLDATECPPTFGTDPRMVQTILAGGFECLVRSVEGAEDDEKAGNQAVLQRGVRSDDFVLGIAASSTTPFVRGALRQAVAQGAYSALLTCHLRPELEFPVDRTVVLPTGPEVLTGSTRLKAGTATKLFLNRLTTGAMIRIGKVYRNRMVDLDLTCRKLRARAIRTTAEFTGLSEEEAEALLRRVGGSVKVAILVYRKGLTREEAVVRLARCEGRLRQALGES